MLALVGLTADERRHVGEDRVLAEVVADDLGDVGVDRLVVGDPCSRRVDQRHVAGPIGIHEAWHPDNRVSAEHLRIEEVVVDPPVDDVDPLQSPRRPHEDLPVDDNQIGALHELHPHLPGEEAVLEVGRVVNPWREDDDGRIARLRRRHVLEHRQELLGVVLHRADAQALEELREGALHHLPVLEDVRHPRRRAEVVLEDIHAAVATTDEVGAGDVAPHAPRRRQPGTRPAKALPRVDEPVGYDAILDDPALVVDIVDEQVEGVDPLLQAALDRRPLGGVDDPRHDVERPDLLRPRLVAVDVERDPHREERLVGSPLPGGKLAVREGGETTDELLGARSGLERFVEKLVPESVGGVRPKVHGGGGCREDTETAPDSP